MILDPLDVVATEKSVRSDQDGQDQHCRIDKIATRATQQGIENAGCNSLDDAEQDAGEQRASYTVQSAQNGYGHALEQQLRERLIDALYRTPEHTGNRRDHRRHGPRQRDAALDRNADRPGRRIIIGNRTQNHTHPAPEEQHEKTEHRNCDHRSKSVSTIDQ
ncbi:hypothetical protein chiPu_0030622 [Chiloscyllium punctatum]|uniref:Uncharacterized protein n=1 Tax=Chiloscyllium punctatum TaxID=137246 RepID=A0A401TUP8_CHIPU|nr:hypothetical protein [Chiloscyllium punctatum]